MAQGRLKVYGWGREGEGLTPDEGAFVVNGYHHMFGVSEFPGRTVPAPADYALRAPRLTPPAAHLLQRPVQPRAARTQQGVHRLGADHAEPFHFGARRRGLAWDRRGPALNFDLAGHWRPV
jgi:hypothetical protein